MADFDLTQSGQEIQNILDGAAMQTDLTAEIERAEQAEQQLQGNIDIEETRAKAAEKQNADDIDVIEGKIPAAASSENQLADKAFVNSSIATATATYRGAYNLVSDLHLTIDATEQQIAAALAGAISTADNNDYCFVQVPTADATPTQIAAIERYKFNGTAWAYEYTLNNSGFTADQWAALNSGITTGLVAKLAALPTNDELTLLLGGKQDVLTFDNVPTEGSNNPVKSGGVKSAIDSEKERAQGAEQANAGNIAQVVAMIPAAASSENQLADKNFVNSSIATNTATYRGAYNEVSDLSLTVDATHEQIAAALAGAISTADNNDYCFVQVPTADSTPTQIAAIERYKFNGTAWAYEYTLNNSGFTADQWAAINSGITSGLVAKLAALPTNDALVTALAGKQPMLTFDNVPTENSTNPVKSGGVYAAIAEEAGTRAAAIAAIVALIPSAASALNQLADKAFVNSSISSATAVFKGTFNVVADLELNYNASQAQIALMLGSKIASADNNDYCFVQIPTSNETPLEIARTDRYKYNGTAWAYEYTLNNSGFTAAQWAAINSGITELLKDKLVDLPTATELTALLAAKQNQLTFDTTPTTDSTNPVTSGGVKTAIDDEKTRAEAAEEALDTDKADKATTLAGYGITDAYTKNEVNNMITTPNQQYVTVATYASLPASGSTDTIYRVSNYNGANNQVDNTVYSEYAWNGTQYVFLDVKSQIGEVFDITVYNSNTKYANLSAALGVDGANIPATLRRGGMSVKYVQTSDNMYVQYRLMANAFSTTVSDWQGVDDEPTAGSDNLVKSGGAKQAISDAVKRFIFRIGNQSSTSVNYRASALNPMPIRRGDMIVFNDFDFTKYSIEIYVKSVDGTTTYFNSPWLSDAWKQWRSSWDGLVTFSCKKPNDANFSESDINELSAYNITLIPKEVEMSSAIPMLDTWEEGRDIASDIDELNYFDSRIKTGLFAYKCQKGDSISFGRLVEMGYDNITIISYTDELVRTELASSVSNYVFDSSSYIRLQIGPKSGNTTITSEDISNFKKYIKINHKNEYNFEDSASQQELDIVYNSNLNWETGETVQCPNIRALTKMVLVNKGDRIELDAYRPADNIGIAINSVAYYDKNGNYLGYKTSPAYKYYLHDSESIYVRLSFDKPSNAAFTIGELDGKVHIVRECYNYTDYYLKHTMFELGSLSGIDGGDTTIDSRVRINNFIYTEKPIAVIIKDYTNYAFFIATYNTDKKFIRDTDWNTIPIDGTPSSSLITPLVANVSPNNGEYYFRVVLKKVDNTSFTDSDIAQLDDIIEIQTLDESYKLPSYYNEEILSVQQRVNDKFTPNAFNCIILTDSHDDNGSQYKEMSTYLKKQLMAAVELSNKTNALFIAHCGDLTTGYTGKDNILHLSRQIIDITSKAKCPVFFVRGNHDDATDVEPKNERTKAQTLLGQEFLAKIAASGLGELHTIGDIENNTAYYFDFLQRKIRVIVLDNQVAYPVEESGGYLVYTGGQGNWRGMSEEQIKWLVNDALVIPDGYRVIFLQHDMAHSKFSGHEGYGQLHNFPYYNAIKIAFNEKASSVIMAGSRPSDTRREYLPELDENGDPITYPSWITSINFSNRTGGNIIAEISGHHHSDTFWKDEAGIIQDNIGSCSPYMQWNHWEPPYGVSLGVSTWESDRTPETIKEAAIEVLLLSDSKANRIRFGAKEELSQVTDEYNI